MGVYISELDLLIIGVPLHNGIIFRSLGAVQHVEQALLADVDLDRDKIFFLEAVKLAKSL